ncbi:sensor domain-containing diguanylate cyclase [Paralimibaculum aggregatum]|uniref:diguanylate cyclase n=2 Tax=Paralimibaculum aggregatum TaxID=3036245 RepID=A0ABQ6LPC7_9RHOB|nr:sensor domain-containing diguanylate cyclase [Limibaculum sp. NKW23]
MDGAMAGAGSPAAPLAGPAGAALHRGGLAYLERVAKIAAQGCAAPIGVATLRSADGVQETGTVGLGAEDAALAAELAEAVAEAPGPFLLSEPRGGGWWRPSPRIAVALGVPLREADGRPVGSVCVMDRQLRPDFGLAKVDLLGDLGMLAMHDRAMAQRVAIDSLTGATTREHFFELLAGEVRSAWRSGAPLALLLADLDHFKHVNDRHGHAAGDAVLHGLVAWMRRHLRRDDAIGRLGGEEFAVLLPGLCPQQALGAADRLRRAVAAEPLLAGEVAVPVTVSIGLTAHLPQADGIEALQSMLARADLALYRAKTAGRNRVEVEYGARHRPLGLRPHAGAARALSRGADAAPSRPCGSPEAHRPCARGS